MQSSNPPEQVSGAVRYWLPLAILLTALGLWSFASQLEQLWQLWTTDPLRSIGALIPPVSLWLALRAWRSNLWADWRQVQREAGRSETVSRWGLTLMIAAMALAVADGATLLILGFDLGGVATGVHLLPAGLLLCVYASGAVLLFGGTSAWRRAAFALLLLLLVNPVPGAFNSLVDLPLQALGARTARGFAALIGVPVSSGTLTMMFAPNLGIFIAAGCDGLRGAVAMGLLALVIGHLRNLRPASHALFVLVAVVLAYFFNLLRLCAVIGYYWFALRIPVLGHYGTEIDYLIGGILFFCAAGFLFAAPAWGRRT